MPRRINDLESLYIHLEHEVKSQVKIVKCMKERKMYFARLKKLSKIYQKKERNSQIRKCIGENFCVFCKLYKKGKKSTIFRQVKSKNPTVILKNPSKNNFNFVPTDLIYAINIEKQYQFNFEEIYSKNCNRKIKPSSIELEEKSSKGLAYELYKCTF